MKISGMKSFVNFMDITISQLDSELENCFIPNQFSLLYGKCFGVEQALTNLDSEIEDERLKGYIAERLQKIESIKAYCKPRF